MKLNRYITNLDSFIFACIGFYAIYLYTSYSGVGLSPDSLMYASAAESFSAHGNMVTFTGTPITFFPVFYPFFLGIIQLFSGTNAVQAGYLINCFLFAAVVFTSGWIMERFMSHSRIYKILILIAIVISPALLEIYSFLWSETLFILEILLFIIAYWKYTHGHTLKALIITGIITAVACITRYAGITIVGTGCLLILLDFELPVKKKIGHLLLYGMLSISLLVANLAYNSSVTGLSTGTREPSITPFSQNLFRVGTVINDWGALSNRADSFAILVACVIMLSLIGVLAWKTFKQRINSYENVVIGFAVVYGLFMVILATFSRFEPINSRLLSPMFIPLLISCTSWVPDVLKLAHSAILKYSLAVAAIAAMLLFEYATVKIDYQRYDDELDYGVPGYSDDSWNKSEFGPYLKKHKNIFQPGVPVYSDANEAVWLFTGLSSQLVPHSFFRKDVEKFYKQKRFYLVWFDSLYNSELVPLKDIMAHRKLVKIGGAKEGEVYLSDEKK
ncbi:hypothetical protein [Mucilaginibacter sp.]|jgi:hypothetical protein|uniref:hypothetical protein n=1 Tax=Mucilaginibacter sp. TaxID=1882438 RepID=UPI002CFC8A50|nr:hypothetical protein [Mucilaginibacter sp.]HTI57548.1 hypothetical protein [Mucilaginibacter sp.]